MKPGVFQGKKFPFTPKRRKKSLGSQCNNIIDTRHDLAAFRSKLANLNVSWLRSYSVLQHRGCVGVDPKNSDGLCKRLLIMCYVCGVCSQLARVCHYMYLYLFVLHQCVVAGVGFRA